MTGKISNTYRTLFSTFFALSTLVITLCIDFFLSPFIVQHIGVEANGYVHLANNLISFASLVTLALNSMGSRFVSIEYNKNNFEECNKYYSSIFAGNALIILLLIAPALLCIWKLETFFNIDGVGIGDAKLLFLFAFCNFFVSQLASLFNIGPFVKNQMYFCYLSNALVVVVKGVLYLVAFSCFSPKVYFVTFISLLTNSISVFLLYVIKRKILPDLKFSFKFISFKHVLQLIKSGIWNSVNQCGNLMMTGFDLILTNWIIGPTAMGILSVAKTIPTVITTLSTTLNNSLLPGQTLSYTIQSKEQYTDTVELSVKVSTIFVLVPVIIFSSFSIKFYQLWQPSLDPYQLSLLSFLSILALIPLAGVQVLYNVLTTMNKLKVNALSFLLTGLINIGITILLVFFTDLSIFAVAGVSSILTCVRYLALILPYIAKLLGKKQTYFYKYVVRSLLFAFMISAIGFPFAFLVGDSWRELVVAVIIVACLSVVFLYEISFTGPEKQKIGRMIERRKK